MFTVIFLIWFVFALACAIIAEKSENEIFGFFFLISIPIIFYIPLFLK